MSAQGPAGLTGYVPQYTRDAQDWTRSIKERLAYITLNSSYTGNKNPSPIFMKYGNGIRLTYDFGRLDFNAISGCSGCTGNAFHGASGSIPFP